MDGNRRWAVSRSLPAWAGHRAGMMNIKKIAAQAFKRGVKILTIFAFSTENWHRRTEEVDYLMALLDRFLNSEITRLAKRGWRIKFFGRREDFSATLKKGLAEAERISASGRRGQINVCLSYGGRDEIVRAVKKIVRSGKAITEIDERFISSRLDSAGLPDPDLIIRTSGERRLSGFLLWQSAYSELFFVNKYWPDFEREDLDQVLGEYEKRQRRFGE